MAFSEPNWGGGTTNKTHLRDYENAITENTAAILRVHPSNYKIQGFTSEVPLPELVTLAHANGLLLFDDVGAGSLIDFSRFGFDKEPTLIESVAAGADVVTASGDKLIGASQAGLILGRAALIQKIRKNQFARIVRAGKLTLAALEATLTLFLDEAAALEHVPTLRCLRRRANPVRPNGCQTVQSACPDATNSRYTGLVRKAAGSASRQNLRPAVGFLARINPARGAGPRLPHSLPVCYPYRDAAGIDCPRTLDLMRGDSHPGTHPGSEGRCLNDSNNITLVRRHIDTAKTALDSPADRL